MRNNSWLRNYESERGYNIFVTKFLMCNFLLTFITKYLFYLCFYNCPFQLHSPPHTQLSRHYLVTNLQDISDLCNPSLGGLHVHIIVSCLLWVIGTIYCNKLYFGHYLSWHEWGCSYVLLNKCWEEKFHLSSCNEWCSVMSGYHHVKNQRREGGYGSENMREAVQKQWI